ncbi:hypothetical protein [Streptomyces sp. RK62]|uniref:hypothetical protein n=1 Tax=Streptomyces sp. RK62 TaxID=2824893 RepID=UPI001B387EBD|nr:hypothetical protein [Streptomyces sp. RK62]MBQ0999630.1 hypothetical protein [Streptomyces sp. RK62]
MSGNSTTVTELTSQYSAQVTADLERNRKEQDRIAGEIEALQGQLAALRHDQAVLENIQRAIGAPQEPAVTAEEPGTEAEQEAVAAVPAPRAARRTKASGPAERTKPTRPAKRAKGKAAATTNRKRSGAKKATKSTAETAAGTAEAASSSTPSTPSLVELVRDHLAAHEEPRSAAEITSALAEQHPERGVKATVVRSTLEGLVARNQAHRSKQGRSVFYTVPDTAAEPSAPTEAAPEQSD